jgi:hypothetical protein
MFTEWATHSIIIPERLAMLEKLAKSLPLAMTFAALRCSAFVEVVLRVLHDNGELERHVAAWDDAVVAAAATLAGSTIAREDQPSLAQLAQATYATKKGTILCMRSMFREALKVVADEDTSLDAGTGVKKHKRTATAAKLSSVLPEAGDASIVYDTSAVPAASAAFKNGACLPPLLAFNLKFVRADPLPCDMQRFKSPSAPILLHSQPVYRVASRKN